MTNDSSSHGSRWIHGYSDNPTYHCWKAMFKRCRDPRNRKYRLYGGRGITVCNRWELFEAFLEDMGEKPDGLSIERIDSNGNYEPSNCVWADWITQNNNTSRNRFITFDGRTQTAAQWSREVGLPYWLLSNRLRSGWTAEKALTTSRQRRGAASAKLTESDVRYIRNSGLSQRELADMFDVSISSISLILLRKSWTHLAD